MLNFNGKDILLAGLKGESAYQLFKKYNPDSTLTEKQFASLITAPEILKRDSDFLIRVTPENTLLDLKNAILNAFSGVNELKVIPFQASLKLPEVWNTGDDTTAFDPNLSTWNITNILGTHLGNYHVFIVSNHNMNNIYKINYKNGEWSRMEKLLNDSDLVELMSKGVFGSRHNSINSATNDIVLENGSVYFFAGANAVHYLYNAKTNLVLNSAGGNAIDEFKFCIIVLPSNKGSNGNYRGLFVGFGTSIVDPLGYFCFEYNEEAIIQIRATDDSGGRGDLFQLKM